MEMVWHSVGLLGDFRRSKDACSERSPASAIQREIARGEAGLHWNAAQLKARTSRLAKMPNRDGKRCVRRVDNAPDVETHIK
jgi:hypothetical protein